MNTPGWGKFLMAGCGRKKTKKKRNKKRFSLRASKQTRQGLNAFSGKRDRQGEKVAAQTKVTSPSKEKNSLYQGTGGARRSKRTKSPRGQVKRGGPGIGGDQEVLRGGEKITRAWILTPAGVRGKKKNQKRKNVRRLKVHSLSDSVGGYVFGKKDNLQRKGPTGDGLASMVAVNREGGLLTSRGRYRCRKRTGWGAKKGKKNRCTEEVVPKKKSPHKSRRGVKKEKGKKIWPHRPQPGGFGTKGVRFLRGADLKRNLGFFEAESSKGGRHHTSSGFPKGGDPRKGKKREGSPLEENGASPRLGFPSKVVGKGE